MKKLNHSKYRNTGIIFEILTRNIISDVVAKRSSVSLGIIRKYFMQNSELSKELQLYQTLQEVNDVLSSPDKLIDIVINTYTDKVDRRKLIKEKYELVGAIKKSFDLGEFFKTRIANYKLLASIYKLFEYSSSESPHEHMNCRELISEHMTGKSRPEVILSEVQTIWKNENPDTRRLAYKIMVDKYNDKYSSLNESQKTLLSKYVNEDNSSVAFRDYIYGEAADVKIKLMRIADQTESRVMKIKLVEISNLVDRIISAKSIKDEHLSSLLKYYQLIEELG